MSTTIKSNTDGSSAIQTGGVDRIQITTGGDVIIPGALTAGSLPNFTGANQSLTSNGFQKLPGGLILQWGVSNTVNGDNSVVVTFPTAFTTSVYTVIATAVNSSASVDNFATVISYNTTTVTLGRAYISGSSTETNYINWIAIGK